MTRRHLPHERRRVTKLPLQYVNEYRDVRGKIRRYFRRPGHKLVPLPGLPGSDEFMRAYQAALVQSTPLEIGADRTQAGTIDALIVDYFQSTAFTKALAPETQRMRRNILDRFRTEHGGKRVATLQSKDVPRLIKDRPVHAQKNWLKALRGLMLFAISENYRADDPTAGVKPAKPPVRSRGHMTWGDAEIAAYRKAHPLGTTARLAIELLLNVAARRGDAHKLGVQHIKGGKITWRPHKTARSTGRVLSIRIIPALQAALDAMPARDASLAFLLNSYGKPFASAAAFGNKFADWCKQAGLEPVHCDDGRIRSYRAHGLRKAACKALAHAGCTGPEIMAISGHSSLAQVQVYIDEAEADVMAEAAITKLEQKQKTK
jgi:integrase/recombinase XerD